jgi:hypothetical protein
MKIKIAVIFWLLLSVLSFSQTVIKNPNRPQSSDAGRTVRLQEVLRIRDDGDKIIFKYPQEFQWGEDGSLYFYTNLQHFKYDSQGKFVFRVVNNGQGPGEAEMRTRALLTKDALLIQAWSPPKVMRFDLNGNYLGEERTTMTNLFELVAMVDGKIYAFFEEHPFYEKVKNPDYYDVPISLYEVSPDFKSQKKLSQFPYRWYLGRGYGWQMARFDYAYKDLETLFIVHAVDYQIDHFNIKKNRIERIIKRKYDRVKRPQEKREPRPGLLQAPQEEYYYDINKLLVVDDRLWVITSTTNERKCRLVDVYDMQGRYLDNFYLEFPKGVMPQNFSLKNIATRNGFLYTADEHENGTVSIGKYEIVDEVKRK